MNTTAFLTLVVLLVGLVFGGGTRNGFIGDVILQLAAVPLLIWSIFSVTFTGARSPDASRRRFWALVFCVGLVVVPLLQLLPLPIELWGLLPGRDVVKEAFDLIGEPLGAQQISMVPEFTWLAFASLIPPIAVFLGMIRLSYAERRLLSKVIIGLGLVSVFLGLMQLAQGPNSALRFFEFTNKTEAVGFFANRNHFAALLYVVTLFASCWVIEALASIRGLGRETLLRSRAIVVVAAVFLIFIALVIGQAMARSRAGLMLSIIALFAVLALAMTDRHGKEIGSRTAKLMFGAAAFAIVFSLQFALLRILERFEQDPLEDARVLYARKTFELAKAYLPLGTGMGTFVPVYAMHEKPADLIPSYANRAHNDILEVSLESGFLGIVLMLVFALWLLRQTVRVWAKRNEIEAQGFDLALMKASTVGLWLLAAHSFVDYPLRTGAIMTLAAFACGLLIPPPSGSGDPQTRKHQDAAGVPSVQKQRTDNPTLQLPKEGSPDTAGVPREPSTQGVRPRELWQTDKEWPESWRTKDSSAQSKSSSKSDAKGQDPGSEGKS